MSDIGRIKSWLSNLLLLMATMIVKYIKNIYVPFLHDIIVTLIMRCSILIIDNNIDLTYYFCDEAVIHQHSGQSNSPSSLYVVICQV